MAVNFDRARLAPLKDTVAVVGVGETDYGKDYRGAGGQTVSKGEARYDSYTLASRALKRALDDAGLKKDDIDGLCVGGTLSGERASEQWGLNPRWSGGGDAAQCIIEATLAINAGLCTTVALVYGNAQRSMDTAYGGARVTGGAITSYFYYAPWGMTSHGARSPTASDHGERLRLVGRERRRDPAAAATQELLSRRASRGRGAGLSDG